MLLGRKLVVLWRS